MDPSLQLALVNITPSAELKALIRKCVARLGQRYDQIIRCCVMVEPQGDARHTGCIPNVRIDVLVPDEVLLVINQNGRSGDVLAAVHHAFESATRQIEEYKTHRKLRVELCESIDTVV